MKKGLFLDVFDYESYINMVGLFLIFVLTAFGGSLVAQELVPVSNTGKGFDVNSGIKTSLKLNVEGKTFDIYKTKSGSEYVVALSKEGNQYALFIGASTDLTFEGKPVRVYKSGTYVYFTLNPDNSPVRHYLKKKE